MGGREGGYSSDWDGGGKRQGGYSSDMEYYAANKHRPKYNTQSMSHIHNMYNVNRQYNPYANKSQPTNNPYLPYNNVAYSARGTIRNDEMYSKSNKKTKKSSSQPNVNNHFKDYGVIEGPQQPPPLGNGEDRGKGREVGTIKEEASSDDDQYKAQLIKASAKLQKSPSDIQTQVLVF
jgi:hypothetical protein